MELKSHVVQNLVRASPTWILKYAQNVRGLVWTTEIPQTGGSSRGVRKSVDTTNLASDPTTNPLSPLPPFSLLSSFDKGRTFCGYSWMASAQLAVSDVR